MDEIEHRLRLQFFTPEPERPLPGRIEPLETAAEVSDAEQVDRLIVDRTAARARKDFKESDRIRDELAAMGVAIKDGKDADGKPVTSWEIA